jgi:hypothetical protein
MKKLFVTLGVIFLVLILLGALGFGYVAYRGNALDKESKAYANAAIPAIINGWNEQELLGRASPEFQKAVSQQQVDQLFRSFQTLGRMMTFDAAEGQALMSATTQNGKKITARYQAKAYFEQGKTAKITIDLIEHGDQWQISAFNVMSPHLGAIETRANDTLDKESKAYADAAIRAIVANWNQKQLRDRASPEFNSSVTPKQLDDLFHKFHGFGHLKKCDPAQGHAGTLATNQGAKEIGAEYFANATFEKGAAVVDMTLIKHGDQWQIVGFFVKPPGSAPK